MHIRRYLFLTAILFNLTLVGGFFPLVSFHGNVVAPIQVVSRLLHTAGPSLNWSLLWGGSASDWGHGVAVDSEGNVVLGGYTESYGPASRNLFVAKYNATGSLLWNKTWGRIGWGAQGFGVAVDYNNSVYIAGFASTPAGNALLVKYNATGAEEWNRTWGGVGFDYGESVAVDNLGNPFLIGWTESFGSGYRDAFIAKYAPNGTQLWNATWGWPSEEQGEGVALDNEGSAYLVGRTNHSQSEEYDAFIVKYDETGVEQWNRTWGEGYSAVGNDVAVDEQGNVYLAGGASVMGSSASYAFTIKYNKDGTHLRTWVWDENTRPITSSISKPNAYGVELVNGSIYLAGYTICNGASSAYCAKYDAQGRMICDLVWGGPDFDMSFGIAADRNGSVFCAGVTKSYGAGMEDAFLLKYSQFPEIEIWINFPWDGIEFFYPPSFSLAIAGANISSMWYTLDQGVTNYTLGSPNGTIDDGGWAALPSGEGTIRFYVNNTNGLEDYADLIIIKAIGINPWYFIFVGGIAALCVGIIFRKIRSGQKQNIP